MTWGICGAGTSGQGRPRPLDAPSPTITGHQTACWVDSPDQWQGSPFMAAGRSSERGGGTQLDIREAAVLQGFPADYPFQGSQASQHQQCGDAIPPLLAAAILSPILALFAALDAEAAA